MAHEPDGGYPKRRYTKLKPDQWAELTALYATGGVTLEELADQFSVSVRAIQIHLAKGKVEKGSAARTLAAAATAKVLAAALPTAETVANRIKATNDHTYADAVAMQDAIRQTVRELATGVAELPLPARIRVLDHAAAALDRVHRTRRVLLAMDKENADGGSELPVLPIGVLSDEGVAEMRARQRAEDYAMHGEPGDSVSECEESDDVVTEGEVEF